MIERKDEIEALGAAIVLVAYDEPGLLAAKMMRGLEVPWAVLLDSDRQAYGVWGSGGPVSSAPCCRPSSTGGI